MQNTIRYALFLLIVSGSLFVGCDRDLDDSETTSDTEVKVEEQVEEQAETDTGDVNTTGSTTENTTNTGSAEEVSAYQDGTYTAAGTYASPAGPESITVTLKVKDGAVSSVSIVNEATNEASIMYQENFAKGISAKVVGKSLDEIGGYSAINGSSLTPNGFDAALEAIKDQASS